MVHIGKKSKYFYPQNTYMSNMHAYFKQAAENGDKHNNIHAKHVNSAKSTAKQHQLIVQGLKTSMKNVTFL